MQDSEAMPPTRADSIMNNAFTLSVPTYATTALDVLEGAGFESWIVGGYVRDALLHRPCADVDIATSAAWREVQHAFEQQGYRTHETGTTHGTITVIIDTQPIEITTYRTDGTYLDARHPQQVTFVQSIEEDLARRDFTINAMAYNPMHGLLDPYGGLNDLATETIRAVGEPERRFSEDALRILRACRFAAQLGFSIEAATFDGMVRNKGLLARISIERVTHELERLLTGAHAGRALMDNVDVLAAVLPELMAMKGFEQHTPYHIYDVLEHTAHVIENVPAYPLVRWAALFHDMGKPAAFFVDENGTGHFYGHAAISVLLARGVMGRLGLPSAFCTRVLKLVERHDDVIEPTPKAVKRALARLNGDEDLFAALCDLKRGDARSQAPQCVGRIETVNHLEAILADIQASNDAFCLKKLAVNGRDALAFGVPEGPLVGQALNAALDAVIDDEVPNERTALETFLVHWVAQQKANQRL